MTEAAFMLMGLVSGTMFGLWWGERRFSNALQDYVNQNRFGKPEPQVARQQSDEEIVSRRVNAEVVERMAQKFVNDGVPLDKARAEAQRIVTEWETTAGGANAWPG